MSGSGTSLRARLFLAVVFSVLPVSLIHMAVLINSDLRAARTQITNDAQDLAAAAIPLLQSTLVVGDLATAQETLDNIMGHGQFAHLRLLEPGEGHVLVEGRPSREEAYLSVPDWFVDWVDYRFDPQRFSIQVGGTEYGTLELESSPRPVVAEIWWRMATTLAFWLATLGVTLLLLHFTLRRGLLPLEELARAAHRFGKGDLGSRAPVGDVPELAETARAFNRMADNLAEAQGRQEERVRQAARELESLIARIPAGVYKFRMLADGGARFDFVSQHWCDLLEIDADQVYQDAWSILTCLHPDEVDSFRALGETLRANPVPFHWEGRLRDGLHVRWLRMESVPTRLENGDILWDGIQYDITAIKEREAELEHIAHYDPLTGIPNRMLLADRLRQALAHAQRNATSLAVCYLDLDGFKPINDALGHDAGDVLLVEMARRLRATVRSDETVSRIGGDEFVLLLAGLAGAEEYEVALNRILEVVRTPFVVGGQRVSVSASIGIALYPGEEADPDLLLRHADQAMYQAKQAGRSSYHFFDPHLEQTARHHREMLQQIEHGMAGNEFELYYEPKVNMRLGTVVGFEALIRWRHGDQGVLPPRDFLPLIEDSDLIIALGDWVLDRALAQLGEWRRQGIDLSISVNVAPRQLMSAQFIVRLRQLLALHADAPPDKLEIEIVETAALADTGRVAELIVQCRQLGVSFALDDFGTGYSSLTYLKQLPAQTLKIDQSFVRDMLVDANDLAIVEGVIGLTEVFRRRVIAEGVETRAHCALLLNLGCEVAQGYGIARPMPADQVAEWLRDWKPDPEWRGVDGYRWPRDDLPLVVAENNHRTWVDDLEGFVEGDRNVPPEMNAGECRFGQWLTGPARQRFAHVADFFQLEAVHGDIHDLGHLLMDLVAQGRREDARSRLSELRSRRDQLLELLRRLKSVATPPA